ncbi:MAG: hypothetical protein ACI4NU_07665 [Christensenellales bacterium]
MLKQTIFNLVYILLQCTWGLPQTLLGLVLFLRHIKAPHAFYRGCIRTEWPHGGGVSLGLFIFTADAAHAPSAERRAALAAHEYGHTLQSLLLGPLYLFTVGIISFTWANAPRFRRMRAERGLPYSHCFVERWADRLGGSTQI